MFPSLKLQASGGIYDDLADDPMTDLTPSNTRQQQQQSSNVVADRVFFSATAIQGNYAIAPANSATAHTLVVRRQEGKVFST